MAFAIKNATTPNLNCKVRSVANPANLVDLITDANGVASIDEVELAIRLVANCGYSWVNGAPPAESFIGEVKDVTAAGQYDVTTADADLMFSAAAGHQVCMLPVPAAAVRRVYVKKTDGTANTVTINGNGALIDGNATLVLSKAQQAVRLTRGISSQNWRVT